MCFTPLSCATHQLWLFRVKRVDTLHLDSSNHAPLHIEHAKLTIAQSH